MNPCFVVSNTDELSRSSKAVESEVSPAPFLGEREREFRAFADCAGFNISHLARSAETSESFINAKVLDARSSEKNVRLDVADAHRRGNHVNKKIKISLLLSSTELLNNSTTFA